MNGWMAALLPLIGVVVGSAMQYWFSRVAESRRQLQLLKSQSYVDYLRAVTKAAHGPSHEDLRTANAEATDAKARLAVYGTSSVITALARFEETGAIINNERARDAFVALVSAMRDEQSTAIVNDLELVLFGSKN